MAIHSRMTFWFVKIFKRMRRDLEEIGIPFALAFRCSKGRAVFFFAICIPKSLWKVHVLHLFGMEGNGMTDQFIAIKQRDAFRNQNLQLETDKGRSFQQGVLHLWVSLSTNFFALVVGSVLSAETQASCWVLIKRPENEEHCQYNNHIVQNYS